MLHNNKYAFFDFDETIVSIKSMFAFKKALMEEQGLPHEAFADFMDELMQRANLFTRSEVNRWYYSTLKGIDAEFSAEVAVRWSQRIKRNIYIDSTCRKIHELKNLGYQIVVVSGSAQFIISEFLKDLDIYHSLCSTPEVKNNIFTGDLIGEPVIGTQKRQSILAFLHQMGVSSNEIIVVGDHISDLPMLEIANQAMVVNPDKQLKNIAQKNGWLEL
ncbi:HAD-IB family hydrolase [Vibrio mimicus]